MSIRQEVFADYEANVKGRSRPSWLRVALLFLKFSGFRAGVLYRLGHRAQLRQWRLLGGLIERWVMHIGVDISTRAEIGGGLYIPHPMGIVIGSRTRIGERAYILHGVTLGGLEGKRRGEQSQPFLGEGVLIGAAKILGPVRIGNNVRIGANAVVLCDAPDDSVLVGVPARVVGWGDRRVPPAEGEDLRDRMD